MWVVSLVVSISLTAFCDSGATVGQIDAFDIPISSCSRNINGIGVKLTTTQAAIESSPYRTLSIKGFELVVTNVSDGDFLDRLDIMMGGVVSIDSPNLIASTPRFFDTGGVLNVKNYRVNPYERIRIFHTNDVHCHYANESGIVGLPKFAKYVADQKASGVKVLALDAGDFSQGMAWCALTNGSFSAEALGRAGYDAATLGNHEFDYGREPLRQNVRILEEQGVDVLSDIDDTNPDPIAVRPYKIYRVGGIRVGIYGMITPTTSHTSNPPYVRGVNFPQDTRSRAREVLAEMRPLCDVVIMLAHLGWDETAAGSPWLAEGYDGVDVIIDGHSHTELDDGRVVMFGDYGTLIVQTGWGFNRLGVVDILVDRVTRRVVGKRAELLDPSTFTAADQELEDYLAAQRRALSVLLDAPLNVHSEVTLGSDRSELRLWGNNTLGLLITEGFRNVTGADFAFLNGGAIRNPLPAGDLTFGDVLNVLPFGNAVAVINMTGDRLLQTLSFGTRNATVAQVGGFPLVSGIKYQVNLSRPYPDPGRVFNAQRLDRDGNVLGPVEPNTWYTVTTLEYLRVGGDQYVLEDLERVGYWPNDCDLAVEALERFARITMEDPWTRAGGVSYVGSVPRSLRFPRRMAFAGSGSGTVNSNGLLDASTGLSDFYVIRGNAPVIFARDEDALRELGWEGEFVSRDGFIIGGSEGGRQDLPPVTPAPAEANTTDDGSDDVSVGGIAMLAVGAVVLIAGVVFIIIGCRATGAGQGAPRIEDGQVPEVTQPTDEK